MTSALTVSLATLNSTPRASRRSRFLAATLRLRSRARNNANAAAAAADQYAPHAASCQLPVGSRQSATTNRKRASRAALLNNAAHFGPAELSSGRSKFNSIIVRSTRSSIYLRACNGASRAGLLPPPPPLLVAPTVQAARMAGRRANPFALKVSGAAAPSVTSQWAGRGGGGALLDSRRPIKVASRRPQDAATPRAFGRNNNRPSALKLAAAAAARVPTVNMQIMLGLSNEIRRRRRRIGLLSWRRASAAASKRNSRRPFS